MGFERTRGDDQFIYQFHMYNEKMGIFYKRLHH